jgi:hypothetical protein
MNNRAQYTCVKMLSKASRADNNADRYRNQVLLLVVCNMQGSRVLMQMMTASELVSGGLELAALVNRESGRRGARLELLGQKARLW